jgi:hypothetical protein
LKRLSWLVALALVAAAATVPRDSARAAGDAPDPEGAGEDLQAELDALFREIEGGRVPMLAPDRAPSLIIASTRRVLGEVAPCG